MRYRKLDANNHRIFGRSQADFYVNVPAAPAQAVLTRLELYQGEWFLDTSDGTAWNTKVLGKYTASTRDPTLRARMLGTQGVTGLPAYASQVNRQTRAYTVQATVDTVYGRAKPILAPLVTPS